MNEKALHLAENSQQDESAEVLSGWEFETSEIRTLLAAAEDLCAALIAET